VRQLETGKAIGLPVAVRISGDDAARLRAEAERVKDIFRESPLTTRVRDDWGDESFTVRLRTDPDRANLAGVSNYDVAAASATAISGQRVTTLREGDKQIPVAARLRMEERAQLADINNLYVYSSQGAGRVPLGVVSSVEHEMQTEKLRRRNQFRTITVSCFPRDGALPSEVMSASREKLNAFAAALPPGYKMEIGGEEEEQVKGFKNLAVVLLISIVAIFLALVFQFKHAIKPLIVFAAIPFGMVGALAALWVMGSPFGFMAFLGCVSLVGVIVRLESGKTVAGAALLYAVGRQSNADLLKLEAAGVPLDNRGRISVNEHFQTAIPHIYAAGDVIGFPALAATSMEQGRLAACHMFGAHSTNSASPLPYGVYTIPEISMIGKTERQLTEEKIPYEVGIARYEELARGQILGDQTGRLKLLFDPRNLKLLGIHIIGEGATELVHIGQAIMNTGATIEYFRDTVFNYPTLAEAYKVAALNGLNKLRN
jgi:AcrB/AcrD/AcrF family/Pyridine nucleotide-disulphide oxidoreductase, dimerisation domain/Pyridine nucleotide-disulphide oxidoreductase